VTAGITSAATAAVVYAVVATCVLLVLADAVGAVGVPVRAGEARGALAVIPATIAACVNAVVAICVLLAEEAAVGAAGVPVSVGLLKLALVATAVAMFVNSSSISVPLTVLRGLPVVKASFVAKFVDLV
jgi:hypothetical protein